MGRGRAHPLALSWRLGPPLLQLPVQMWQLQELMQWLRALMRQLQELMQWLQALTWRLHSQSLPP